MVSALDSELQSRPCGLTEMFRETNLSPQHKPVDTSCAKALTFSQGTAMKSHNMSQNTVGGFFAESQELGYAAACPGSMHGCQ